jgi:hypothetical protein
MQYALLKLLLKQDTMFSALQFLLAGLEADCEPKFFTQLRRHGEKHIWLSTLDGLLLGLDKEDVGRKLATSDAIHPVHALLTLLEQKYPRHNIILLLLRKRSPELHSLIDMLTGVQAPAFRRLRGQLEAEEQLPSKEIDKIFK